MGTVTEIESAIECLGNTEFAILKGWLDRHVREHSETLEEKRLVAIRKTAGCLSGEDAENFARAVEEAGRDIPDSHDW